MKQLWREDPELILLAVAAVIVMVGVFWMLARWNGRYG